MSGTPPAAAERPTVVLLHSSGSSPRQWEELVEQLRHQCRVLTVEFYGHGLRPDWPQARQMSLADEAQLVVPLLEMAGGAHVVGHSYGAAVAVKLASMRPQLVRSVVGFEPVLFRLLIDDTPNPKPASEVVGAAALMRDHVKAGRAREAASAFVEFWSGAGGWQALSPKAQQSTELRMPSVIRHFEALFAEPFPREQLARTATPMLFMSGARTVPVARRIAQLLRAALPLAWHEKVAGVGHLGPMTHPHIVNERIRAFLNAHLAHPVPVESMPLEPLAGQGKR